MEKLKTNIPSIEWPFLILHGEADKITKADGSVLFHEKTSSNDKTLKVNSRLNMACRLNN